MGTEAIHKSKTCFTEAAAFEKSKPPLFSKIISFQWRITHGKPPSCIVLERESDV